MPIYIMKNIIIMPELPPVIATVVDAAPAEFKSAAALACLAPLGVVGSQLEGIYCDGRVHTPVFQTAISAPQASGKSWLVEIADRLLRPVTQLDDEQLALLKAYKDKVEELKCMVSGLSASQIVDILGPCPEPIVRDLGPKVSTTAMMELMHNAQGLAMVMRCDEADSITKAWSCKNTDNSDMLRIGWDGGWYKQHMASVSKTFSGKVRLRLSTHLAGTPDAFRRLFPNVQNGAVSRQLMITLDDMFGRDMPSWRRLTPEEEALVDAGLARLDAVSIEKEGKSVTVLPRHRMDVDYVNVALIEWCRQQATDAVSHDNRTQWVFHKRSAVMGFRAALLAHFLWGEPQDSAVRDKVCAFALWVADQALLGLMKGFVLPEDAANQFFAKAAFDSLATTFTAADVEAGLKHFGLATPCRQAIWHWKRQGRIRLTDTKVATPHGRKRLFEKVSQNRADHQAA